MRPDQRGQLAPEDPARDRHPLRLAERLRRRATPAARSRAPPRRTCRPTGRCAVFGFAGSTIHSLRAVAVDQLELVLEARDVGRGRGELPGPAAAASARAAAARAAGGRGGRRRGAGADRGGGSGARSRKCVECVQIRAQNRPFRAGRAVLDTRQRPAAAAITAPPSFTRRNDEDTDPKAARCAPLRSVWRARAHGRRRDGAGSTRRIADGVIKACRHKSGFLLVPSAGQVLQALGAGAELERAGARPVLPARGRRRAARCRPVPPALQARPARPARPGRVAARSTAIEALAGIALHDGDGGAGTVRSRPRSTARSC